MNQDVLKSTIDQSLAGSATFPEIVGRLMKEGVESYHVDLVRGENRYYSPSGESVVLKVDLGHGVAADTFHANDVEKAIRKAQAGRSDYRTFVREILQAGCVYYIAYLSGKRVSYFGRDGSAHVEFFPNAK